MSSRSRITEERLKGAKQKGLKLSKEEEWALRYFHRLPLSPEAEKKMAEMSSLNSFKLLQNAFDKVKNIEDRPEL